MRTRCGLIPMLVALAAAGACARSALAAASASCAATDRAAPRTLLRGRAERPCRAHDADPRRRSSCSRSPPTAARPSSRPAASPSWRSMPPAASAGARRCAATIRSRAPVQPDAATIVIGSATRRPARRRRRADAPHAVGDDRSRPASRRLRGAAARDRDRADPARQPPRRRRRRARDARSGRLGRRHRAPQPARRRDPLGAARDRARQHVGAGGGGAAGRPDGRRLSRAAGALSSAPAR